MLRIQSGDQHEKFTKLCALAASGSLAPFELAELQSHLENCEECREVFSQYLTLTTNGVAFLIDKYGDCRETNWDNASGLDRLLTRVSAHQASALNDTPHSCTPPPTRSFSRETFRSLTQVALAAGLLLTVAWGAYRLGARTQPNTSAVSTPAVSTAAPPALPVAAQGSSTEKNAAEELLAAQTKRFDQLRQESAQKEQELAKLRSALRTLQDQSTSLTAASSQSEQQVRLLSQQRDDLAAKIQALNESYSEQQAELATLRAERDKAAQRVSALELQVADLNAMNRDQAARLNDTEQYLSSDRDIRELMGARKLYIADVFDVDGTSRTQKPFGRVFYTQGKSLIFYAFDLDHEPGVVNASTFQVWGQRERPQGEQALPMNLGILYMDNESKRRWVMRFDDPKKLAEIDAVFVTVEPRGGSHKPTSKPFLYALLRNEANHP
jgi:hypothetical protein